MHRLQVRTRRRGDKVLTDIIDDARLFDISVNQPIPYTHTISVYYFYDENAFEADLEPEPVSNWRELITADYQDYALLHTQCPELDDWDVGGVHYNFVTCEDLFHTQNPLHFRLNFYGPIFLTGNDWRGYTGTSKAYRSIKCWYCKEQAEGGDPDLVWNAYDSADINVVILRADGFTTPRAWAAGAFNSLQALFRGGRNNTTDSYCRMHQIKSITHELAHSFHAPDHYHAGDPGDQDYCLMGMMNKCPNNCVIEQTIFCDYCLGVMAQPTDWQPYVKTLAVNYFETC